MRKFFVLLLLAFPLSAAPVCNAGAPQSVQAGGTVTLNGTGSTGTGTLSYFWQQSSSLTGTTPTAFWASSQAIGSPSAILPQFGVYNFTVTVTDSTGSASCTVHDGAGATDPNGVILYPNTPLGNAMSTFLGPQIQQGQNPWPQFDASALLAADGQRALLGLPAGSGKPVTALTANYTPGNTTLTVADTGSFSNPNRGQLIVLNNEEFLSGTVVDSTHINILKAGYAGTSDVAQASGSVLGVAFYYDFWDWQQGIGSGSCSVSSQTFTCTGSQFEANGGSNDWLALCDSSGNNIQQQYGSYVNLIVWYPISDGSGYGHFVVGVTGCSSNTVLTMSEALPAGMATTSLKFSVAYSQQEYYVDSEGDGRTINYYDNVTGYYLLWLRTGIDLYLIAARQLAHVFFEEPGMWDQGYGMGYGLYADGGIFNDNSKSELGLWLYQMDGAASYSLIPGLERNDTYMFWSLAGNQFKQYPGDMRVQGYQLAAASYESQFNTDPTAYNLSTYVPGCASCTWKQAAQALIAGAVVTGSTSWPTNWNYWRTAQSATGGWPAPDSPQSSDYVYPGPWYSGVPGQACTVTNGSATVACTGTGSYINCGEFNGGYGGNPFPIVFWHGTPQAAPLTNAGFDSQSYFLALSTGCVNSGSNTTLTLTTPYAGTSTSTGGAGYEIGLGAPAAGLGDYGYMMGIATTAMLWAAQAVTVADPTSSSRANALGQNAAGWIENVAVRSDTHGANYVADYINCLPNPVTLSASYGTCSQASTFSSSLAYSMEALTGLINEYRFNPSDTTAQTEADAMFNQMWANPGLSCSGPCNTAVTTSCPTPGAPCWLSAWLTNVDGYLNGFNHNSNPFYAGVPQPKYYGQFYGFGNMGSWPAVRLGGAASSPSKTIYLRIDPADVANATSVAVTTTAPNATASTTTCSTSGRCAIVLSRSDQPNWTVVKQYKSAGGAVLATDSQPLLVH